MLLYKAKGLDTVIGYLSQTLALQHEGIVEVKLVISWCGFDPETGEISPTPEGVVSTSLEDADQVICLGSEEEFLSQFEVDDDEDGEADDVDESAPAQ